MKLLGATLFSLIVFTVCIVARSESISGYSGEKSKKTFWERESKSNATRKADISALNYIVLDINLLDIAAAINLGLNNLVDQLKALESSKIINLAAYTNTELKLMYGPANLEALSTYDNNYTTLIKLLNQIGTKLYEAEEFTAATSYFEYAVSVGSDITNTYVKLCEIYNSNKDLAKINELIENAKKIESLSGPIILDKINNIKSL